jgi:energy-coupling factor transporter ATP-binding protein EcfA2
MAGRLLAAPDAGLGARAEAMIERFRLGPVAGRPAGRLSYGQQKLVDVAMAFMARPVLVLLDEPAAGINPVLVEELRGHLQGLSRDEAATFVVIEHNMDFVMRLAHRVLVLAEGRSWSTARRRRSGPTPRSWRPTLGLEFREVVAGYGPLTILQGFSAGSSGAGSPPSSGPTGPGSRPSSRPCSGWPSSGPGPSSWTARR